MAKNFGSAGSSKTIKAVAQASNEKANIITVKMIADENLIDYSKNNEDITNTSDLENSMKELGFTDPIEATDFNMEEGKYTIVSGHRRRMAGRNIGIKTFPVIVRHFKSEDEVRNYVLLANSQRDSIKDPLLFCKRYKMHEEYLRQSNFKGSIREEIAKRLGISVQQADRYNLMNRLDFKYWELVENEKVGMSSVVQIGSLSEEDQNNLYKMIVEEINENGRISREKCQIIINNYKNKESQKEEVKTEDIQPNIKSEKEEDEKRKPEKENNEKENPGENVNPEPEKNENNIENNNKEKNNDNDEEKFYKSDKLLKDIENLIKNTKKFIAWDEDKLEKYIKTSIEYLDVTFSLINKLTDEHELNDIFKELIVKYK